MKRSAGLLATLALLLTGCGGAEEPTTGAEPETSSASASPTVEATDEPTNEAKADPAVTCSLMIGGDGGIFTEAASFLRDTNEVSAEGADEAESISEDLGSHAASADAALVPLIEEMQVPLDDYVEAWEAQESWTLDAVPFQDAANELIEFCEPLLPGTAAGSDIAPEPEAMPTTGDYGADLANVGVVPEGVEGYREFIVEQVCLSDLEDDLTGFKQNLGILRSSTGVNDDALRLTVTYDCPERLQPLEETFAELDAEG